MAKLALGKMVGPLPLGGWAAVVAGGLGVGAMVKRNKPEPVAESAPITSSEFPLLPARPASSVTFLGPQLPGPVEAPPITTNQQWETECARRLIGRGAMPFWTQQALRRYVQGLDPLNGDQAQLVDLALRDCGPPPIPPAYTGPPDMGTPVPVGPGPMVRKYFRKVSDPRYVASYQLPAEHWRDFMGGPQLAGYREVGPIVGAELERLRAQWAAAGMTPMI